MPLPCIRLMSPGCVPGNVDLVAQHSLTVCNRLLHMNIVTAALKDRMRTDADFHEKIAGRTAVAALIARAGNAYLLFFIDAGREFHRLGTDNADLAHATAFRTAMLDDLACATALLTGVLRLNDAKRRALVDAHKTRAAAVGAGFG